MAFQYSLAFLTVSEVAPPEAVRIASECGYSHVGLRLLPSGSEGPYPIMTDQVVLDETIAALKETGVKLADIEIVRIGEHFNAESFRGFLERGALMGAGHVLVAGDDPDRARITRNYIDFCKLAAEYGMTADLEFMPWTAVPDIRAAYEIIEAADQPNAGLLVDALHYHKSAGTPEQVAEIPKEWVHYVQFCDSPLAYSSAIDDLIHAARAARLYPGEGELDLLSLLKAIPSDTVLSIEVPKLALVGEVSARDRAAQALAGMKALVAQL